MRLLTDKILWFVRHGTVHGSMFGANAFNLDSSTKEVKHRSEIGRFLWSIHVYLNLAYFAFVCFRFVEIMTSNSTLLAKGQVGFALVFYAFIPLGQLTMIRNRDRVPGFIRRVTTFFREMEEGDELAPMARTCEKFMQYSYYSLNSHTFALTAAAFIKPDSPELVSSLWWGKIVSLEPDLRITQRLMAAATQFYILNMRFVGLFPIFFPLLFFVVSALGVIDDLRAQDQPGSIAGSFQKKILIYRELTMLVSEAVEIASIALAGSKLLLILIAIFGLFGAVRAHGAAAVAIGSVGITCLILLIVMFNFLAEYHKRSKQLVAKWRTEAKNSKGLGRKAVASLRHIRVSVAGLYFVDKLMILTMLKIVFDSTVNILIATG